VINRDPTLPHNITAKVKAISHLSTISICYVRVSVPRFTAQAILPFVAAVQIGHSGVHTGHLTVAILLPWEQHCSQTDCVWNKGETKNRLYRVSQEECARLRESVPYVKLYRYNAKHLYPKLNGYGGNGQRILKLWQLLLTYWLPNTYWNWQEYVVYVILIAVRNIKVTCEWYKAIKLNYKNTLTRVIVALKLPSTLRRPQLVWCLVTSELPCADCSVAHTPRSLHYHVSLIGQAHWTSMRSRTAYSTSTAMKPTLYSGHYLRKCSTLDIVILGFIGIV